MKKITFLMLFLTLIIALPSFGQIHIGGGSTTSSYVPINGNYGYSVSQQIVLKSEYEAQNGAAGSITKIRWKVVSGSGDIYHWENWKVFIGHTTKTSFSNNSDWIPINELTEVFDGVITATDGEWTEVEFSTPFDYNGIQNLVITVIDLTDDYGDYPYFASYEAESNRGIYGYRDYTPINITNLNDISSWSRQISSNIAQLQLFGELASCIFPLDISAESINATDATFNWTAVSTDYIGLEYELRSSGLPGSGAVGLVDSGSLDIDETSITLNDLIANTPYTFYLRSNCSTTENSFWGVNTFRTACAVTGSFTENFGNVALETFPFCWSLINDYPEDFEVSVTDWEGVNNSNALYAIFFSEELDSGVIPENVIIVSPETDNLGNGDYRVRFKIRKGDYDPYVKVSFGVMSSNVEGSSFELIDAIELEEEFVTKIYDIELTDKDYFAFKLEEVDFEDSWWGAYASGSFIIDDVVYEPIPSCQDLHNDVEAQINYNINKATISWTTIDDTQTSFDIEYGVTGFAHGEGTLISSVGNPYVLTNLTKGTTYDVYVRSNCGNGDLGAWTDVHTFLFDYCESIPTSNDNEGITNFVLNEVEIEIPDTSYYVIEDTIEIFVNQENTSALTFSTGYTYDFHYWIDLNKDGVFDNTTEKMFTGVSTVNGSSWDFAPSTSNIVFELGDVPSGVYKMRIGSAYSGQGQPNPCYDGSYGITLDLNVEVIGNCKLPEPVIIDDITDEQAVVSWAETLFIYDLEYGPIGFTPGTGTYVENVEIPFVITGLTANTQYDVRVILKDCDDENLSSVETFTARCNTPIPTGSINQTIIDDLTVAAIEVEGENLKYYTDAALTQEVTIDDLIQGGAYYITQTWDCESPIGLKVNVTARPRTVVPVVDPIEYICDLGTLSDLEIGFLPNTVVKWYETAEGEETLPLNTQVESGMIYYVTQSDSYSESYRVAVKVEVLNTPNPVEVQAFTVCYNTSLTQINLGVGNVDIRWYFSLGSSIPLGDNASAQNNTYYVTTFNGICESERVPIQVTVVQQLEKPNASQQNFCTNTAAVSDLVASGAVAGAQYVWYNSATTSIPLQSTDVLQNGTYYVTQKLIIGDVECESPRKPVTVKVTNVTAPQSTSFEFCESAKVSDLEMPIISGVTYNWYLPNSNTPLTSTTNLQTGNYFVSKSLNGCESAKVIISVIIKPRPTSPTGNISQNFMDSAIIADLEMNESNVIWYISEDDALNNTNPLQNNMPLTNGQVYYAVVVGPNGCTSLPTAVTVTIVLGLNDLDLASLKYYPNPADSELTVSYKEPIRSIEIYDILGKQIKVQKFETNEVRLDVSRLSSGTYMLKVQTDSGSQFVKVVKK